MQSKLANTIWQSAKFADGSYLFVHFEASMGFRLFVVDPIYYNSRYDVLKGRAEVSGSSVRLIAKAPHYCAGTTSAFSDGSLTFQNGEAELATVSIVVGDNALLVEYGGVSFTMSRTNAPTTNVNFFGKQGCYEGNGVYTNLSATYMGVFDR